MSIFVSIAAYRDPELVATVRDCREKAADPDALRFGICWQHDSDDAPLPWKEDPCVKVIDVDARESQGACWARSQVQRLYDGEDYYLQLDSHHRFAYGWDKRALECLSLTPSPRPILTGYPTPFTPGEPDQLQKEVYRLIFDRFTDDGIAMPKAEEIPRGTESVGGAFLAAGFLMAPGRFVKDVPYDPELYFEGEECTLAIRAFTHGYDLFYPPEIIVWHEYERKQKPKHWDDHALWHERDARSKAKIRRFLTEPMLDGYGVAYGLGLERTFGEYEAFSGLDFKNRRLRAA